MAQGLRISCDDCVMQATDACDDCVVTFICGRDPDDAVIIDAAEARAVRMLARNGLVPELRHAPGRARGGGAGASGASGTAPGGGGGMASGGVAGTASGDGAGTASGGVAGTAFGDGAGPASGAASGVAGA